MAWTGSVVSGGKWPKPTCTCLIWPIQPLRTIVAALRKLPLDRCCEPVWKIAPYRAAVSRRCWASPTVRVSGFSQYTSLPASIARLAMIACQWSGTQMNTASMSSRSRTFSNSL